MKRSFKLLALIVIISGVVSLFSNAYSTSEAIVQGNSQFALDLYSRLKNRPGNLFFSPYSISSAMAIMYEGARGETAKEIASVFHFPPEREALRDGLSGLQKTLDTIAGKGAIELNVANALWCQRSYPFLYEFITVARNKYRAGVFNVDFATAPESARQKINSWVREKTGGKILNMVGRGVLKPLTKLVITNAIYFKGNWEKQFKKERTKQDKFYPSTGNPIEVPMMNQTSRFKLIEAPDFQAVELPYVGSDLAMIIFLPRKRNGISEFENSVILPNLTSWINRLDKSYPTKVHVFLPRFRTTSSLDLSGYLASMGMPLAFSRADFSAINGRKDLAITNVLHKAFVDVNEEGTEAAATTAIVVRLTAVMPHLTPTFRADHPFVFVIVEKNSKSILFMGRITDPTK